MYYKAREKGVHTVLSGLPEAVAVVNGGPGNELLHGVVKFYQTEKGVLVAADIHGLPTATEVCHGRVFGFHLHDGSACGGNGEDPFSQAGSHYNPSDCPHPYHAGDMPPLFGVDGQAFLVFLTDRFSVTEIIGKAMIIHDSPDDFTTQPSGNAGNKIACGIITRVARPK